MCGVRALIVTFALCMAGAAWAEAPTRSPIPRARPAMVAPPTSEIMSIADAAVAEALRAMAPPMRPAERALATHAPVASGDERLAVARSPQPRRRPAGLRTPPPSASAPVAPTTATARAEAPRATADVGGLCGARGLTGQRLTRITSATQGCGIDEPVRISAVQGIALSPPATLDCDTARAFDTWVRDAMVPAMRNRGGGVTRITIGSHYACRPRNNQTGARISEHGRGRAIDVMGFRLADGETVPVAGNFRTGRHRRALQQMYQQACGTFRTTLGPSADRFHQDHFHFDLARHRSGGTYCR